jgi:RNA recognition motif-containing protein
MGKNFPPPYLNLNLASHSVNDEGEETTSEVLTSTIYVKNLNFETTDDSLYNLFAACGPIR